MTDTTTRKERETESARRTNDRVAEMLRRTNDRVTRGEREGGRRTNDRVTDKLNCRVRERKQRNVRVRDR